MDMKQTLLGSYSIVPTIFAYLVLEVPMDSNDYEAFFLGTVRQFWPPLFCESQ